MPPVTQTGIRQKPAARAADRSITLVKDTSLASVIGTVEMFTRAKQIVASPNTPGMLALAAAGLFYYVFNYIVAFAMERAERSLAYYQ